MVIYDNNLYMYCTLTVNQKLNDLRKETKTKQNCIVYTEHFIYKWYLIRLNTVYLLSKVVSKCLNSLFGGYVIKECPQIVAFHFKIVHICTTNACITMKTISNDSLMNGTKVKLCSFFMRIICSHDSPSLYQFNELTTNF